MRRVEKFLSDQGKHNVMNFSHSTRIDLQGKVARRDPIMNTLRKRQIRHPGVIIAELRSNLNLWHKCRFWTAYFDHSAPIYALSRSQNGCYGRTNGRTDGRTNEHTHMILFGLPTQYALRAITDYYNAKAWYLPLILVSESCENWKGVPDFL